MRVLVCGDREWTNEQSIRRVLTLLHKLHPETIVVEGDARGADKMAGRIWLELTGYDYDQLEVYPADWTRYGKAAGRIRNRWQMNESFRKGQEDGHYLTYGVAFHRNLRQSRGTRDMVTLLEDAGVPVLKISK
jgi:YspA, cpYpsA-related SLOG family